MSEEISQNDQYTPLVSQILNIEEITWGGPQLNYVVRYRGHLTKDSIEAYDQIAAALKPHRITPLFLEENDMHTVLLKQGVIEPTPSNPWVNQVVWSILKLDLKPAQNRHHSPSLPGANSRRSSPAHMHNGYLIEFVTSGTRGETSVE